MNLQLVGSGGLLKKLGTILGILVLATGLSSATTVTMQLTGFVGPDGGANTSAGVYTYPYYFSVTSGTTTSTNIALLCDSYDNEVWQGETWTANEVSLSDIVAGKATGLYSPVSLYEDAAWLFSQMGTHPNSAAAAEYNWAIWGLFSSNARNQAAYTDSGAAGIVLPTSFSNFDFSGYSVYVPANPPNASLNGNTVNDVPQEYIGYSSTHTGQGPPPPQRTPEPATITMMAAGLVLLGRKLRKTS